MKSPINYKLYLDFLKIRKEDIDRIARHSRGAYEIEDIHGEIILRIEAVQQKLTCPIDFLNPEHQDLLIGYTYNGLLLYGETTMRRTVPLDSSDQEDYFPNYSNTLTKGEIENPLNRILSENDEPLKGIDPFSLGYAWVTLINNYQCNIKAVAFALKISVSHSLNCFRHALFITKLQLSLPLKLSENPGPWRQHPLSRIPEQLTLSFEEELGLFDHSTN